MARPPVDLVAFFGQHRCQQIISDELNKSSTTEDPVRGCWLSQTGLTSEGYARVSKKTNSTLARQAQGFGPPHIDSNTGFVTVFLHRVAYVSRTGQNIPAGMQASHLCDEPNCFYPQHIIAEDGNQNASRKNCIQIRCLHHNFNLVMDLCSHTPKCIKKAPDPAVFYCCLGEPPSSSEPFLSLLGSGSQEQASFYSNIDYSDLPEGASDEGPTEESGEPESQIQSTSEASTDDS